MSFTPLDLKKLSKSKKKGLNLKLIIPLITIFIISLGIIGGMIVQRTKKIYKARAEGGCPDDKFLIDGDCIIGKNGLTFSASHFICPNKECPASSCSSNDHGFECGWGSPPRCMEEGVNRVCFTGNNCGVEQIDIWYSGGDCWKTICNGQPCGQPQETPTPTITITPTPPTNTPTPTTTPIPTITPTPTIRWLNCGERCDNVNQQYVKCWAGMGIPENHLVCVDTINNNSYCSEQLLMQQCENLGLGTPYASCCTSVSVTPTNTPTPTTTLTPTPTPTGTPGPTSTPTNTPPPGSTNTPVPPTPTEIILVQATNTPAALAQATTVPTIVSVGTKPPFALILLPLLLIILALVF